MFPLYPLLRRPGGKGVSRKISRGWGRQWEKRPDRKIALLRLFQVGRRQWKTDRKIAKNDQK